MHFGVRQDWILILKRGICITDFIREGWACSGAGGVEADRELVFKACCFGFSSEPTFICCAW